MNKSWGTFTDVGTGTNGRVCTSPGKMLLIPSASFGRTFAGMDMSGHDYQKKKNTYSIQGRDSVYMHRERKEDQMTP